MMRIEKNKMTNEGIIKYLSLIEMSKS